MTRLGSFVLQYLQAAQSFLSHDTSQPPSDSHPALVSLESSWKVLGPFQIGTREAPWGADPLEAYGGFHALSYTPSAKIPSSLASNGTIQWSQVEVETDLEGPRLTASIKVSFPEVDWSFLQVIYGWSALQWQGWIRGSIIILGEEIQPLNFYLGSALEFWIDDEHYFGGDFYKYGRAPTTIRLKPGLHQIDVRVIRDVRAMGGVTSNPSVTIDLQIERTSAGLHRGSPVLLPDRLRDHNGPTAGVHGSVILHNVATDDIFIHSIWGKRDVCKIELLDSAPIRLVPGQSRPIGFTIACIPGTSASSAIDLRFQYSFDENGRDQRSYFAWGLPRQPQDIDQPHRMTFLHPAGIVSYAILRAPPRSCDGAVRLPVLVQLHGAGVDADDDLVKHSLDDVLDLCAWVIFPTGVTPWSGDDWHNWGWADVEAAIASIESWIDIVDWDGPGVDVKRWLVSGHSNGGQGTYFAATHHPDRVIAVAPASGYSSIQNYVPYTFWHPTDPARISIVQSQLAKYRHEILLENVEDIPMLIQHGSEDDNVPAYHSRLMYELGLRSGAAASYNEVAGQGHWWDGVMTTPPLVDFYRTHLNSSTAESLQIEKASSFSVVTADPGTTGSKHGVRILLLRDSAQLGHLTINMRDGHCKIKSSNVVRWSFAWSFHAICPSVTIDDESVALPDGRMIEDTIVRFISLKGWQIEHHATRDHCKSSSPRISGAEAILRTNGALQIVQHSNSTSKTALDIANNLCQYFNANVEVAISAEHAMKRDGNIISIVTGRDLQNLSPDCRRSCSIDLSHAGKFTFMTGRNVEHSYEIRPDSAVAAMFLRPLHHNRLEMVIWADTPSNLHLAARLIPIMTGSGQPDFVIISKSMSHRGLDGMLAMGFFDDEWCPTTSSFFN